MKSIAFFNNKGGVGKTTLVCNVASYLAHYHHKKVLIVDADPQCNSTIYCLNESVVEEIYAKKRRGTIEAFFETIKRGKGYITSAPTPVKSPKFGFDIIPGDPSLALIEDLLASDWNDASSGKARGLQTTFVFLDLALKYEDYDFIFFDLGPSLGAINRAVMLASDFFVMPMSVDIFSLMAVENISLSLKKWRRILERGLEDYETEEGHKYHVSDKEAVCKINFAGFVVHQYTAKTVRGERIAVSAYERIASKIPTKIQNDILSIFNHQGQIEQFKLGEIHNLHSLVPLSQMSNSPIFMLKAADGIVGAHFSKVKESKDLFRRISKNLLERLGAEDD